MVKASIAISAVLSVAIGAINSVRDFNAAVNPMQVLAVTVFTPILIASIFLVLTFSIIGAVLLVKGVVRG